MSRHFDRLMAAAALSVASLNLTLIAAPAAPARPAQRAPEPVPCRLPRAIDGDTIRCAAMPRPIRLAGIDAPELPGHCRTSRRLMRDGTPMKPRICAPGDPFKARTALQRQLDRGSITLEIHGRDRYQRPLAIVRSRGRNIVCPLLAHGHAQMVTRWDIAGSLAECGR